MASRVLLVASVLPILASSTCLAAECKQAHAIYGDRDGAYELTFEPVGSEAAVTSHHFKVKAVKGDLLLNGHIMVGEVPRSNGMIMHNCPDGDVTGEEIAACTVWEGLIYPMGNDGALAEVVPDEGADAAYQLIFAGFGPALRYSNAWEEAKLSIIPWDVLTYKGCAQ